MGERIQKSWGWSQEVYRDELTRVVRIHVEPGGFCSWHKHERQMNSFAVLSGELYVETKQGPRPADVRCEYMLPGFVHTVTYGDEHRFRNANHEPVEALEIYARGDGDSPPDEFDIVRFSEGGIAKVNA